MPAWVLQPPFQDDGAFLPVKRVIILQTEKRKNLGTERCTYERACNVAHSYPLFGSYPLDAGTVPRFQRDEFAY